MTVELLRSWLGWCTVLDVGLLLVWFLFFWWGHDLMYRFHSRFAKMTVETFDAIHYSGMALFKVGILLLNLCPYLSLVIVG